MSRAPIFYDASGRRRRRFAMAVAAFVLLVLLSIAALSVSIGVVPAPPLLPVEAEHAAYTKLPPPHDPLLKRARRDIVDYARLMGAAPPRGVGAAVDQPLAIGFHVPWDESSVASLRRHINDLDWLIPGWVSVTGTNHDISVFRDTAGREIINRSTHRPLLLPMIQNAKDGVWDAKGMEALLRSAPQRKAFLDKLEPWLVRNRAGGAFFDFEELSPRGQADFRTFLREAKARFAKRNWVIAIAVPIGAADDEGGWNIKSFAAIVDRVFLMAYDEHETSGDSGPIASQGWFERSVARAVKGVPRNKIVVAIGSYGYDWHDGGGEPLPIDEAWQAARESSAMPVFDKASGNTGFAYMEGSHRHVVWLLDAASAYNQMKFLSRVGLNGVAVWRLGAEDPSLWSIFGRSHRSLPAPSAINAIPAGTDVDIEGSGEILKIAGVPVAGVRQAVAGRNGGIADVHFVTLPSPYIVARTGYRPGLLALTFDDGPDPVWTPRILDVLKEKNAPATFFVIGENALTQRRLLERMIREGHEIGSHTYTHPNLAGSSETETRFQLNTTQRLFQAFTGHSLRLFRAPYFGDAEPTTADEISPALQAQNLGYISVGLHVDPDDWKRPGTQEIIDRTVADVIDPAGRCTDDDEPQCSRNIILLHDSGGDRSQTLAALPQIIDQLRAKGYRFVPVSELAGIPRDVAMPPISKSEQVTAQFNLFIFSALGGIVVALGWIFFFAISIGIARAVILSALALIQARRESRMVFPPIDPDTFVTVMIPAFNEELVIERAVRGVLASTDVRIEVIVIDDGSSDATSAVVDAAFAHDPRVKLLTLENGGKARALNRALDLATGEIVIALDADTQFEPTTIARLARWFVDPTLGAVAGNAKVGNRVNLLTRFQAVEYITAQNLERRALARLDAMAVVPGAVGAWRLAAIKQVGGYPDDTLAEDQDLTIAIQRAGWKVTYDQYAVAWTESPETIKGLAKQRFRWAFGTLQCLWKHGSIMATGKPRGLARVGLPQAILFQIVFAAISPIIDLALIVSFVMTYLAVLAHGWAQTQHDVEKMLIYWLVFTLIDLLAAIVAFALERREDWRLLWLLIPQRFGYRQIMYYVVLKAITQALRGPRVGWGKLVRTGRVNV
ncbi:cellulose synthase/poly-beta-1,6-N-acetylglucosamine synthase-like glycosyltransferase/peptidoglycan/xylan/chitin deacetylase (PgdA/CDA1 family)/spore germination protein YaaH [Sphingomonas sp. PvP055]|uniref:polysaccharide deacetylase family protein n=1 Tax=Sphingomonas sp. PvP055 TaxID=3156391 RepID=UPI0033921310